MRTNPAPLLLALMVQSVNSAAAAPQLSNETAYRGMCDASAAVAITQDLFVVASDEDNILRVYRQGNPEPVSQTDMTEFLDLEAEHPECDFEGAAWLGDEIYWITSHGRNSEGKKRPNRRRLFATKVTVAQGQVKILPVNQPYIHLLRDLKNDPALSEFKLGEASELAPEAAGGLNIEGLAATPDGDLLIGFRNPLSQGKALVVPLKNPHKVLKGDAAEFRKPIVLDLGGRGIRSLEYWPAKEKFLIIAGPIGDDGLFSLYEWSGRQADAPAKIEGVDFGSQHPEVIFFQPRENSKADIFSDDGGKKIGASEVACKNAPAAQRSFRAVQLRW